MNIQSFTTAELKSFMGDSVLAFDLAFQTYVKKVDEFNAIRSNEIKISDASMKNRVQLELLKFMVVCVTLQGVTSVENIKNDHVKAWIKKSCLVSNGEVDRQVTDA